MNDQERERNIEQAFHKALKNYGYIFPETEGEIKKFEEAVLKMKVDIPKNLDNPLELLSKGRVESLGVFRDFFDDQIEENLAQAAREGSDIPDDVWKQMEEDRIRTEEKNEDKDPE